LLLAPLVTATCLLNAQEKLEIKVQKANDAPLAGKDNIRVTITDEKGRIIKAPLSPNNDTGVVTFSVGPPAEKHTYQIVVCDGLRYSPLVQPISWPPSSTQTITLDDSNETRKIVVHVLTQQKKLVDATLTMGLAMRADRQLCTYPNLERQGEGVYTATVQPSLDARLQYYVYGAKGTASGSTFLRKSDEKAELILNGPPVREAGAGTGTSHTPSAGGAPGVYNTSVQTTISLEATVALRLLATRRLQMNLELPFVLRPSATVKPDVAVPGLVKDYRSWFLTPSLRLTFAPNRGIYPWLSLGSGVASFVPGGTKTSTAYSVAKAAFQAGAGVDMWPLRHLGFRTNIRNFYSGRPQLGIPLNLRNTITLASGILIR
jgi:hypothetical protein